MAAPATTSPLVTVEKLVVNQAQGLMTVELAQQGLEGFNATCQAQPMPFDELINVMLIAQGFGASSLTAYLNIGQSAEKLVWTLNVEAAGVSNPSPTPLTFQLTARQQAYAERVLTDAVADLAKRGHEGKDLNKRSISLATALQVGFSQLSQSTSDAQPNPEAP